MNLRIPITAAAAVVLASFSLSAVLAGNGWLGGGIGAVVVVTATGLATRMSGLRCTAVATAAVLIAVVPLLAANRWPLLITGLAIVAATAASATGARWLRGFAVGATYVATLLIFLNLVYASGPSFGHVIPSYGSLTQLGQMVRSAFARFGFAPPVTDTRAVSLVGAAGIGLVAIMVDILAVRMRRPAVAGLPLLVLFSVPVASTAKNFGPLQAVTFALGMTGFLTLLSTAGRERLRMWGRLVTFRFIQPLDETGAGPDTRELAASGRRIGLAAVCLALLVPVVLPVARAHDVFATTGNAGGSNAGTGVGGVGGLDVMQSVQQALQEKRPQPVLTYTTNAADPTQQYLQMYVLNYLGGQDEWLPDVGGRGASQRAPGSELPYPPVTSAPTTTVTTTVTLTTDAAAVGFEGFLPAPYAPVRLRADTPGWTELPGSLALYNDGESLGGMRYTVTSQVASPTAADINSATSQGGTPSSIETQFGGYTGPDIGRLTAIAHQHTAGAATPLQAALDLEKWLRSGSFRYSLNPNLPSSHWLVAFLTSGRRGYCQQFAWAFAVLARLVGIPSRLAIGYTGGTRGPGATWKVTTADMHAWPELYFPSLGWLRFEPTPSSHGQGTATVPAYATASGRGGTKAPAAGASAGARGTAAGSPAANTGALNRFTHGDGGAAAALAAPGGTGLWLAVGIPVLALLLLAGPGIARRLTRRRRWLAASTDAAAANAAWRELTDDMADYGLVRAPGETPRAVAKRVASDASFDPPAALALSRIAGAAERARYARVAQPGAGLRADGLRVRRALAHSVPPRRRVRAWLLPASTMTAAQELLQRAGDMLRWLDTSWPSLRRQLRRSDLRRAA